jgi:type II secretory pathway pseudopilin PulG
MRANARKLKSCGFSLVEVMLVIIFIAILAGMSVLAMGNTSSGAEASNILAELDAAKSAMLGYSMEYRTRTSDGLKDWDSATSAAILSSLDKYLESTARTGNASARFNKIKVRYTDGIYVGFVNFDISSSIQKALTTKISSFTNGAYEGTYNSGQYSLWMKVK